MIRQLNHSPIVTAQVQIGPSSSIQFIILIDCVAGYKLYSSINAELGIFGRKQGDVSWVNLETSFIDLTPYDGNLYGFEIKLDSGAITAYHTNQFSLLVHL